MVYQRRRTTAYRRPAYRRRSTTVSKPVKSFVRSTIKRTVNANHPLQWLDIKFDGGNVNTTPTMHSLVSYVLAQEEARADDWPNHGDHLKQCKYMISYVHYQLRFQQDVENIESSNTFRTMFYSYIHTLAEDATPILAGTDIDSPPQTEYVKSMYFDRLRTLRAGTFEATAGVNEPEPTPGTSIIKGSKRLGSVFNFLRVNDTYAWEENDIRWEAQSDSVGNGLQLYGFIRVYYRRLQ